MSSLPPIVDRALTAIVFGGVFIWLVWRSLKKSEEPGRLIARWAITFVVLFPVFTVILPMIFKATGQFEVIAGMLMLTACMIVISIFWAPSWGAMVARPLTSLFDGGDEEPEQRPIYSPAEAKRRRSQFREAIDDIREQLEKFPNDFHGQFMLAEIQVQDLNDLQGAQVTIERILNQPNHPPANISSALMALADWHLKYGQDPHSAKEALERIAVRLPNTQFAQMAAQRIAHLTSVDQLIEANQPSRIEMGTYQQLIGLQKPSEVRLETTKPTGAAELVAHLQAHPLDTESRERLALIYAEEYKRVDLTAIELEQLIGMAHQPPKRVAHWLNLLAELQIKYADDLEGARKNIKRIIEKYPNTAIAEQAKTRLAYIHVETKQNKKSQTAIQLGSYEKYLGVAGRQKTDDTEKKEETPSPAPYRPTI